MDEEGCFSCGKSASQVKLLDGVFNNEMVKICADCAEYEDIPVIRKPTTFQLKDINSPKNVKERLSKMAGMDKKEISLDDLRKKEFNFSKEEIDKKNQPLKLVDNFHWIVQNARRRAKLDLLQLSEILGESEFTLKELEKGNLPDDAYLLLKKIEQYFHIKLMEKEEKKEIKKFDWRRREEIKEEWRQKEEDEIKQRLENIQDSLKNLESIHGKIEERGEDEYVSPGETEGDSGWEMDEMLNIEEVEDKKLKFDSDSLQNITIADLQRMRQEKKIREEMGEEVEFVEEKKVPDHLREFGRIRDQMKKKAVDDVKREIVKKEYHY